MADTLSAVVEQSSKLLLIEKEIPIVMPTFGIMLYTREVFSTIPKFVLEAYERFEALCGRESLRYYRTENMTRHKPVTARTFGMLRTWLKPNAPAREYIALELKNGATDLATPDAKFYVFGREEDAATFQSGKPNWLSLAFPIATMTSHLGDLQALCERLFSSTKFIAGFAGLLFEISPYNPEPSQQFAWKTIMRYRGFDLCDPFADAGALRQDALRGVNWLTFVGNDLVKKLGGANTLQSAVSGQVELQKLSTGVFFKAGPHPALGDYYENETLTSYREVFRLCLPIIEPVIKSYSPLRLQQNRRENTTKWLRRLAYEE